MQSRRVVLSRVEVWSALRRPILQSLIGEGVVGAFKSIIMLYHVSQICEPLWRLWWVPSFKKKLRSADR